MLNYSFNLHGNEGLATHKIPRQVFPMPIWARGWVASGARCLLQKVIQAVTDVSILRVKVKISSRSLHSTATLFSDAPLRR